MGKIWVVAIDAEGEGLICFASQTREGALAQLAAWCRANSSMLVEQPLSDNDEAACAEYFDEDCEDRAEIVEVEIDP